MGLGAQPSEKDLLAYWAGTLEPAHFDAVDAWIAALPASEQDRLAAGVIERAGELATLAPDLDVARPEPFSPEMGSRFFDGVELGSGGMGTVRSLRDRVLDRDVAVKLLRPRRSDEPLDAYLARVRAFKREAAITARLEHPGIVPVHDVGRGSAGEPAFAMKRLDGEPLSALVARRAAGESLDLARVIPIILRVAEALAYAHQHGIVHRDVKPENIVIGALGAVSVIDWGLAGEIGADNGHHADTEWRIGTHSWMAPEQFVSDAIDVRVDVFALGGLLMAALTGTAPRAGIGRELDLSSLRARGLPVGLVAVAQRCLHPDPHARYADGEAVAAELQRWLTAGLTLAQEPSLARRMVSAIRRSPAVLVALTMGATAVVTAIGWVSWHHEQHRHELVERVHELAAQVPLDDTEALRTAHGELQALIHDVPEAREAQILDSRFLAALETQKRQHQQQALQERLTGIRKAYRISGPWAKQGSEVMAALGMAGLALTDSSIEADANILRHHPLRDDLLAALIEFEPVVVTDRKFLPLDMIPRLVIAAGPDASWRALGRMLATPTLKAHELAFTETPDSEAALGSTASADLLLALFGPEPRLVRYAQGRIADSPGDFWPRVISARAALVSGDREAALHNALVALGAEPKSLWPHLVLAYLALAEGDDERLLSEVQAGLRANPEHIELKVLNAVALARAGQHAQAQDIVDHLDSAHVQYHLQHPTNHPMDASVRALIEAGLTVPKAQPAIGPVVPHEH